MCLSSAASERRFSFRGVKKDGLLIDVEVHLAMTEIDGRGAGLGTLVEITDARQAAQTQKGDQERLRSLPGKTGHWIWDTNASSLFESISQPMWVYDLETTRYVAVNAAAIQHYGYTREEFLARTLKDLHPSEDEDALICAAETLAGNSPNPRLVRQQRKDGSLIEAEITTCDLHFEDRTARLVLAHDVTRKKQAEAALHRSEREYGQLVESVQAIVWRCDARILRFSFINDQAEILLGYPVTRWRRGVPGRSLYFSS